MMRPKIYINLIELTYTEKEEEVKNIYNKK